MSDLLLRRPIRYLITSGQLTESNFSDRSRSLLETVKLAVDAGIEMVQIREKQLSARSLMHLCAEAAILTRQSITKLLVNERFDIALAAETDGVHLTSTSIPVELVRRQVPDDFLLGASVHTADEVMRMQETSASFAVLGPIFETPGKGEPLGIDELERICKASGSFPLIAVGGIDKENYRAVVDAGAAGYAAIRYLNEFVKMAE